MIVAPFFAGDVDMEVALKQHEVYGQALGIIVSKCNRYTEFARSLLNDADHPEWGTVDHFDHRTLQHAHTWRLQRPGTLLPGEGVAMKKQEWTGLVVALLAMLLPVQAAVRDETESKVVRSLRAMSDRQQQGSENWELVSLDDGGLMAVAASRLGQALAMSCSDGDYLILAAWPDRNDLGTYYDDFDYQPVTLNWRRPALTQKQNWRHFRGRTTDSVIVSTLSGEDTEVENFFTEIVRHAELEVVVATRPAGPFASTTFQISGAPVSRIRQHCG